MDRYLRQYLAGETITVFVRGKPSQKIPDFPPWVAELFEIVSIPVPVPGRKDEHGGTDKMVKSFGLSRVKVAMPPRGDAPGLPRLSALVNAVIELPKELDFSISIDKLRGWSDMYYQGDKFGVLVISEWTPAQSFYTPEGYIQVVAEIADVPIEITDQAVFKKLAQKLFFAGNADVDMKGTIDVVLDMPVGEFTIRNMPVKGSVTLTGYPAATKLSGLEEKMEETTRMMSTIWNQLINDASTNVINQGWREVERESRFQREAAESANRREDEDSLTHSNNVGNSQRTSVIIEGNPVSVDQPGLLSMPSWMDIPEIWELVSQSLDPAAVSVGTQGVDDQSTKESHIIAYSEGGSSHIHFTDTPMPEIYEKILKRLTEERERHKALMKEIAN
ncbi:hypothetical protein V1525DRAFT_2762 [Lipomyces kononenkoae]|uniref:Uncharacterized protein n=1 Tax=Lipomyces kononenkoae TaxID=34357 RepID=A0ACC3TE99_LIPKO